MSTAWNRPRPPVTTTPQLAATSPLGIDRHVPGAASGADVGPETVEARTAEHAMVLFGVSGVAARDLQLHDGIPELLVSAESRVERPHVHFSVLARVRLHAGSARDEPDALLDVAEQIELDIAAELRLMDPTRLCPTSR